MGYSRSLMLRNWQNKGNIFFVYNLLLVAIVMENVIQSGRPGSFCYFIFYQGFLSLNEILLYFSLMDVIIVIVYSMKLQYEQK